MEKEIKSWVFDPSISLFKHSKNERAEGRVISCECPEQCELYKKGMCVLPKGSCSHGSYYFSFGYSQRSRKYYSWISEFREAHKETYKVKLENPQKLEYFMEFVYIPISYLGLNEKIEFYDGGGMFSTKRPILKKELFTAEFISKNILNFKPYAMFGGEIKDYQEKEIPKFLTWLKELDNELFEQVRKINPDHKAFASMTNIGRSAILSTLTPNVGLLKDIHGGLWKWDGEYLTSQNTHASFTLVKTSEIEECRIKPKEGVVVKVTDEQQVNIETKFID